MKKDQNKKGIVALLGIFILLATALGAAANILSITGLLPGKIIWIAFVLIMIASVCINIASVSKRKRKDEDNIATLSKPFAVAVVTLSIIWLLTFIIAVVKLC